MPGPPLELKIYRVKFLKIHKMSFFLLLGPPLDKICSVAPADQLMIKTNTNMAVEAKIYSVQKILSIGVPREL